MNIYIISWTWGEEQGRTNQIFLHKSRAEEVCEKLNRDEEETGLHYSVGVYPVNEEYGG